MDWGAVLRQRYNGEPAANRQSDISVNYLGYYTDNGLCTLDSLSFSNA